MPVFPAAEVAPGTPGALVVDDYQYEFRGLLFGSGTDFQTQSVEGILGLPSARSSDEERGDDHGDHAGMDLISGRTITITMNILGARGEPTQDMIDQCTTAFQVSRRAAFVEYPFVTQRPGHDKRAFYARARRAEWPSNWDTATGKAVGAIQLYATDPRCYSIAETVTDITIAEDLNSAEGEPENHGNLEDGTSPLLEIQGPCTNPRIKNEQDDDREIRIDIVVEVDETLYIDTKARTVFLEDDDRYDTIRSDNQWWVLVPGVNTVTYNRSGAGLQSRLRIKSQDAWTGA